MRIRIANAPVSWGIMEVEGWSPPFPYTTFLDQLQAAGYTGTELGPYGYLPTDPQVLRAELDRRSLTLASAFVPLRLKDPQLDLAPVRQVAQLLQALHARYLVLADALWPEREAVAGRVPETDLRLTDRDWETAAANLRKASGLAAEYGLRCVFHHHAGTYIETPGECARLLELTDLGLCLDTGHYAYGGGDALDAARRFGDRIWHVHVKDCDRDVLSHVRSDGWDYFRAVRSRLFCELGQGVVDLPAILAELVQRGYGGWVVVEDEVAPGTGVPLESAQRDREFLHRLGL
jgi:inosose dehydratase